MNTITHIFRAYDIRGHYGSEINPLMMYNLGIAVAKVAQLEYSTEELLVYVGYDVRKSSQVLAFSFVSGLASLGVHVTFSNTPFPFGVVMYSGLESNAKFTAFITASHLPPDWNGVKFYFGDGVGFSEAKIKKIRDMYIKIDSKTDLVSW